MHRMTGIGVGSEPVPFMAENSKPNLPVKTTKAKTTKKLPARSGTKRSNARAAKKAK